jgi:hypothetical protein
VEKTEIKLRHPIEIDGVRTTTFSMRRPKVRDLRAAEKSAKNEVDREVWLLASLCEVPLDAIDELDVADYRALQDVYKGFLS